MPTAIISHVECRHHSMHDHHPEDPRRTDAISDQLISSGLELYLMYEDAPIVEREQLLRVHDEDYLDSLDAMSPDEGQALVEVDDDTAMNPYTLQAARRAAGASVHGVDLVVEGKMDAVFCNVRPPGHHAEKDKAMGFSFYNNVAVGAAHALEAHGLSRVAIVDFDVHHGNGTEDIFRDDPRVLFCSLFQHPFFPHTDPHSDRENILKLPMSSGTGGAELRMAVDCAWLPAIERFKPDLIMISAGFDAHREDEMGHLRFVERDYQWITEQLIAIVDKVEGCRGIVSVLEGGYSPSALGRSAAAHIRALARV
ncbi:histone deacetylase family protein [Aestuariirhabdus sp. Z084]|uniref:histone deacetylase family protein n=1 Tax=Aestuariirhabdus haliotis TaxID=2918751 RepID=UPI00201B3724|nr:histone deacetylase family protein [Aestuariirhabdus haliotis]MCL6415900.1 histone deacetylase family protein [Aestuariirhabdus haliotis]MCL6419898.1 histone deacetylase family protein [Aestuariirhabdus haliotis]